MADNNIFLRVKKLFSSDVVVRNIGGKRLKVVDTGQIQRFGLTHRNDKFTRMYSTVNYALRQQQALYGMETMRLQLFRDYEVMDKDSIIASALDIYSEETTMKNEMGDMIRIKAGSSNVRKVLENLFYDIMNVDFTLPTWVRGMCKYGDYYLQLELAKDYGVTNVLPLPVYDVKRVEGMDPEKPTAVQFVIEGPSGKAELEFFEVAHFRMMTDSNFLPYGKSMIEPARRVWKQLILMEDAMLIHRIMRAPERRIFKIDVGNIAPNEVDAYMKKIIAQVKKVPYIDPTTGEYNLKFNLQNMTEDFYLPVRGGDSGTDIDSLSGLSNEGQIDDIEYLRNKEMAALKIPKAFLGYEEEVGSKATLAAEDVRFARTIERIQKIIVSELTKVALVHLYIQGFEGNDLVDFEIELTMPSIIYEQEKIELWNSKIGLARDAKDTKLISDEWIYKNIFNMSEDEIAQEKKNVIDDIKRTYRLQQIEDEGNDPAESEQGFGGSKPDEFGENKNYNIQYDEEKEYVPVKPSEDGRKGKNVRTRKKDDPFGDDPIGKRDYDKILKLDGEVGYDSNKKKHLSRNLRKAEAVFGKDTLNIKKIITEIDFKNLENYFLDEEKEITEISSSDIANEENKE
jgi:hypothetical protein